MANLRAIAPIVLAAATLGAMELSDADRFRALLEEDWSFRLEHDPLLATNVGEHRWDDRIRDFRMPSVLAARRRVAALLDSVKAILHQSQASLEARALNGAESSAETTDVGTGRRWRVGRVQAFLLLICIAALVLLVGLRSYSWKFGISRAAP